MTRSETRNVPLALLTRGLLPLLGVVLLVVAMMPLFACGGGGGTPANPSDSPGLARRWQAGIEGPRGSGCDNGSPHDNINTFTGNLTIYDVPVSYDNVGQAMPFTVVFNSQSGRTGTLGDRWTHSFNWYLVFDAPYGLSVVDGNGGETYFTYVGPGYEPPPGIFDKMLTATGGYTLVRPDLSQFFFDLSGRLTHYKDRDGLQWTLTYTSGLLTTITDPVGRVTTLTYTSGLLTRVTVPGGLYAAFQYDTYTPKRLWKITDAVGDVYTFGYSGTRVTSITDPSGSQAWYGYAAFENKTVIMSSGITNVPGSTVGYSYSPQVNGEFFFDIVEQKDGLDRITRYDYERLEDLVAGHYYGTLIREQSDVSGLCTTVSYTYDSEYRVVSMRDSYESEPGGKQHTHAFYYQDSYNPGRVTKYADPENRDLGLGYLLEYNNQTGSLQKITTPEGRVLRLAYDYGKWLLREVTIEDADLNGNPVERKTAFSYWGADKGYRLKTITDARSNVTTFYYDSYGYLDYVDPPLGNNVQVTANSVGDITAVTDGNGNTTSYQHDNLHRLTRITYPDVGAGQKTKLFDWLCCGLDQVTDENGRTTKLGYEPYTNRLSSVIEDYGGLNYQTSHYYDEVGNVTDVTNARGKTTSYTYDDADRLTRADYPDGTYETWAYRDDGRVYQYRDGRGFVTNYHYDADDRPASVGTLKAVDYPNITDVGIVRDKDGLITSFTDGTGTTTNVYYPSTWLKSQTNGAGRTVTLEYNGVGKVANVTAPGIGSTTYAYNALNQITSVTNGLGLSSTFTYYPADSKLFRIYRPGSYIQYEYNARDWLMRVVNGTWPGDQVIYNVLYNIWDNVGNPLQKVEWFPGDVRYATTFTYDGVYRLTLENRNRCCLGGDPYTASYTYDQVGNRLSLTLNGAVTNYTYDDNDKLLTATSGANSAAFGYDLAGNMLSVTGNLFGARTMAYDDESRLTSVTFPGGTDTFTYNAFGQRMGANLEGIARTYTWFGDRLIAEHSSCHPECAYAGAVYADGSYYGPLLGRQMGGQQYPVYDGIGTVRRVVNETGTVVFSNDLDAFGHAFAGSGSATWHPYRFGGAWGYTTMPSGLEQLGARYYWPELGRFVQQDPIGDGMNWYAYVGNNPVVYIDPEGLGFQDWYMGGMGGTSDWIDSNLLFGRTANFGCKAGLYDSGRASSGEVAWAGAQWGTVVAAEAYGAGKAAVAGARAGAVRVLSGNRVKGFSGHALTEMADEGISLRAVADAVGNPLKVTSRVDELGQTATRYIGRRAAVVLNQGRRVVTAYRVSARRVAQYLRNLP